MSELIERDREIAAEWAPGFLPSDLERFAAAYRAELEAKHNNDVSDHVLHVLDGIEKRYQQAGDVLGMIAMFRRDYATKERGR